MVAGTRAGVQWWPLAAVIVAVVVFRVSMVVVMGIQKVTVSLGRSHWQGHTESDESKPEEESMVVVKKPEVEVALKSRRLQWS